MFKRKTRERTLVMTIGVVEDATERRSPDGSPVVVTGTGLDPVALPPQSPGDRRARRRRLIGWTIVITIGALLVLAQLVGPAFDDDAAQGRRDQATARAEAAWPLSPNWPLHSTTEWSVTITRSPTSGAAPLIRSTTTPLSSFSTPRSDPRISTALRPSFVRAARL